MKVAREMQKTSSPRADRQPPAAQVPWHRFFGLALAALLSAGLLTPSLFASCVTFYEHPDYTGRSVHLCGTGLKDVPGDWHDIISGMKLDDGYWIKTYEHPNGVGTRRDYWGEVSNIRNFHDVISSYEILPIGAGAGCLSFFEHPNYKGGTWQWCSGIAGFDSAAGSDWEDKLSSLQISPGYKVTLFEHPNEFGQTTSHFEDSPDIGFHDTCSSFKFQPFDEDNFVMAIMSDPQYGWAGYSGSPFVNGDTELANQYHIASIKELRDRSPSFAGVIINGDLTHHAWEDEYAKIKSEYLDDDLNLYVGMGNHELVSGDCNSGALHEHCTAKFLDTEGQDLWAATGHKYDWEIEVTTPLAPLDLRKVVESDLFYSWDIGDFNFIQVNNYPNSEYTFNDLLASYHLYIDSALARMESHLQTLEAGKKIIINMHDIEFGEMSSKRTAFVSAVEASGRADDIVAFFVGHFHKIAGQKLWDTETWNATTGTARPYRRFVTLNGRDVPVFHSGSAEYNKYLKVEFTPQALRIEVIHSAPIVSGGSHYNETGVVHMVPLDSSGHSTGWLDRDDTSSTPGDHDWEKLRPHLEEGHISQDFFGIEPAYVEMRRKSDQIDIAEAAYPTPTYRLSTRYGGKVINDAGDAEDYEIQFHYGFTPWLDATGTGDLSDEHRRWTDWVDDEQVSAVRGRMPNREPAASYCRDKNNPDTTVTSDMASCPSSDAQVRYYFGHEPLCQGNAYDAMKDGFCNWSYVSFGEKRILNGYSAELGYGIDAVGVNPSANGVNIELYRSHSPGGLETWTYDESDGKIRAGWDGTYCLDVAGGPSSYSNGSNVQLWTCSQTEDAWDFDPFAGKLELRGSSFCLDVPGYNAVADGRNLQIWACDEVSETWRIEDMDAYTVHLASNHDQCVDLGGFVADAYRPVEIGDCDEVSETWTYLPTAGEIRAAWAPGLCWDVRGDDPSSTGWETRFQSAGCHKGTVWEAWDYQPSTGQLQNRNHAGLCTALNSSPAVDGTRLVQESCTTSESFDLLYD